MGIRDTQYHIVAHEEKRNPHMHIVWNRVDCNGRRYNDSHERERSTRACRQITEKYGLTMGEHKSISRSRINSPVETQRYRICRAVFFAMHQTSSIRQMQEWSYTQRLSGVLCCQVGKALSAYHKAYPMKNGATILDVARNSLARQVLHTMANSHDFRDLERIADHDLRHCDVLSDDKAINLVAGTLESIMSADTSTGQDEKRLLEARQHKKTIYR